MTLNSKDWKATESTDFAGRDRHLTVTGLVEVTATNMKPVLKPTVPQGINPEILLLTVSEEPEGDVGGDVMTWKSAEYTQPIAEGQYTDVTVDGQTVKVEELIS